MSTNDQVSQRTYEKYIDMENSELLDTIFRESFANKKMNGLKGSLTDE